MKIWILLWETESGDEGEVGYWTKKPTAKQLDAFIKEHFQDDYESKTIFHRWRAFLPK